MSGNHVISILKSPFLDFTLKSYKFLPKEIYSPFSWNVTCFPESPIALFLGQTKYFFVQKSAMQPRLEIPISTYLRINPDSIVRGPNSSLGVLSFKLPSWAKNSNEKEVNTTVKQDHKQDKELNIQFKLRATRSFPQSSWVAWLWSQLCPPGSQERLLYDGNRRPFQAGTCSSIEYSVDIIHQMAGSSCRYLRKDNAGHLSGLSFHPPPSFASAGCQGQHPQELETPGPSEVGLPALSLDFFSHKMGWRPAPVHPQAGLLSEKENEQYLEKQWNHKGKERKGISSSTVCANLEWSKVSTICVVNI